MNRIRKNDTIGSILEGIGLILPSDGKSGRHQSRICNGSNEIPFVLFVRTMNDKFLRF